MSLAIINLLNSIFTTSFAFIGIGTVVNKIGKFCKVIDENKKDAFKNGFDVIMLDTVEEMNRCVESVSLITTNTQKILILLYDIILGNKFIKKDKDGKIIISNKSNVFSGYKDKILELSSKVKKYQEELSKIKKKKTESIPEDNSISDDSSLSVDSSEISENKDDSSQKSIPKNDNEFYLG